MRSVDPGETSRFQKISVKKLDIDSNIRFILRLFLVERAGPGAHHLSGDLAFFAVSVFRVRQEAVYSEEVPMAERRSRERRRRYVPPVLKKGENLRRITAQGTSPTDA
jgi:hypothetical protein